MLISKDLLSGLIFLAIGIFMVVEAQDYRMGTLLRMGAGYFPTLIGGLIMLVGAYFAGKALLERGRGEAVSLPGLRPLLFVLGGVLLFGFTLERFGLVIATLLLILTGRLASPQPMGWLATAVFSACLVGAAVVIFRLFLALPLQLWP